MTLRSIRLFTKLCRSKKAIAIPATFLILFASTLGLISVTYYFAVEKVNARSQTLKISNAKQDFLSLDQNIISVLGQPGSARGFTIADSGGKLYVQPSQGSLEVNVTYNSSIQGSNAYNPSGYSLVGSTIFLSGNVADLSSNNGVYMNFRSYAGTSTNNFYPSNYALLGSTADVSGSIADLQADDGTYQTFRSYVSASSATSKTDAFIAYGSNTFSGLSVPKIRFWNGDTGVWGGENELSTAGSPVRWVKTAVCPISERALEKIVVTLSDDGSLDAYVFDGTSWTVTNDIGNVGTTANAYRCFDVQYEKTSGDALLVYSMAPNSNFRIAYKTWSLSSGWSGENTYTIASGTAQTAYWISAASKPTGGAHEIAVGVIGDSTQLDAYGLIWDGSSFTSQRLLTGTVSIATEECIAVAYEQSSGYATFVSSTGNNAFSWQWSGSAWDGAALTFDLSAAATPNWFTLKANPTSDELLAVSVDGSNDLNTAYWNGSAWTLHSEHNASVDTDAQRCADFAWEPTGSKGLLVWGTAAGQISYRTFTAPNTWGSTQNVAMGSNVHPWVQLRTNPRYSSGDTMILGAVMEGGASLLIGAIKWDGTAFTIIGTNTISYDTTVITYECFELEFQQFGDPTEFTSEVEFTGASSTESWTQLTWSIAGSSTTANANAIFQLYNYQTAQYPTSGDGYMTNTIGVSDVTVSQNITINPTYFRDGSGNWKMNVTIIKATAQPFDWSCDLVRFTPTHITDYTSEVEFTGTSNNQIWAKLNWTADLSFTTPNVTTTLQLYNYAASQYPASGDGYLTDTIGQTDATKNQTITATPINFRDASGNWAMKIKGTKATDAPFDLQVDLIEFNPTSSSAGNATVSTNVFNGAIGQITYELPYADSPETGLYLKGDSRTVANQSGSLITQLFMRSGAEHPEILLRYRPATSYATAGTEDNRAVNNLRIYVVNLNSSDSISLYGEVPLRISCESTQMTTTKFEFSYNPGTLVVTSILDGIAGQVSIPISSTAFGAVVNVEVVTLNVKVARSVL